jgi:hypothetical protein
VSYQDWRAKVPFSNDEIASQLEADAEAMSLHPDVHPKAVSDFLARAARVRSGYVYITDLRCVLGALIKTCEICGKKALYRTGSKGRCSAHRHVADAFAAARQARAEANHKEIVKRIGTSDAQVKRGRASRLPRGLR